MARWGYTFISFFTLFFLRLVNSGSVPRVSSHSEVYEASSFKGHNQQRVVIVIEEEGADVKELNKDQLRYGVNDSELFSSSSSYSVVTPEPETVYNDEQKNRSQFVVLSIPSKLRLPNKSELVYIKENQVSSDQLEKSSSLIVTGYLKK